MSRSNSTSRYLLLQTPWKDPAPWFRWCDSEMPGAPSWERYASEGNGTTYKPRSRAEFDAQNGAIRG